MEELSIRPSSVDRARVASEALDASAVQRKETQPQQRKTEEVKEGSGQNAAVRHGAPEKSTPIRAAATARADSKSTLETLQEVTEDLNQYFSKSRSVRFQISEDFEELVVQIVDKQSQEVIRSIPPERLMEFKDSFKQISQGILLDDLA